jgi:hypothetical protein
MPRRPRPPLTAREIGAFLAGSRAAKAVGSYEMSATELESLALEFAEQDSPMLQHFELPKYVYWFARGFENRQRLDRSNCP